MIDLFMSWSPLVNNNNLALRVANKQCFSMQIHVSVEVTSDAVDVCVHESGAVGAEWLSVLY